MKMTANIITKQHDADVLPVRLVRPTLGEVADSVWRRDWKSIRSPNDACYERSGRRPTQPQCNGAITSIKNAVRPGDKIPIVSRGGDTMGNRVSHRSATAKT